MISQYNNDAYFIKAINNLEIARKLIIDAYDLHEQIKLTNSNEVVEQLDNINYFEKSIKELREYLK